MNNNKWSPFYEYCGHESSVNTVAWAPSEFGLIFACGSSDGSISIVSLNGDGSWQPRKIENVHPVCLFHFNFKINLNSILNF